MTEAAAETCTPPAPRPLIYDLMAKVMGDIEAVRKTRKNEFHNYLFRGIDEVYNAVQPALVKHGVFCTPTLIEKTVTRIATEKNKPATHTVMTVAHTFYAPDGSHVVTTTTGEAIDTGDKGCNKAMSAAYKYALIQTFCIPTEGDNDTEAHSHSITGEPSAQPSEAAAPLPPPPDIQDAAGAAVPPAPPAGPALYRPKLDALKARISELGVTKSQEETWCAYFSAKTGREVRTIADLTDVEIQAILARIEAEAKKKGV